MRVYKSKDELVRRIDKIKKDRNTIGFVPTMGSLHEGHLKLIRKARKDTDCCVVSIFVNPAQFGPKEDLKKYPRNLKRDLALCKKEKVDIVFAPPKEAMYRRGYSTHVDVEGLTKGLCGASRPGHFMGVTTVVTKLFNIIRPDASYFGQKDAQQAIVIKKMVKDLFMPTRIKIVPIVREKDGLAMSSRNVYLSNEERRKARSLYRSLRIAKDLCRNGERFSSKIIKRVRQTVNKEKGVKIDYISIVDLEDLTKVNRVSKKALLALAVKIGRTRLIDNIILN
ncbi:MAG: pantoate--beta-alanine ligase [Candidatus Omnitrophota bacterium]|jgi:pantoate--beta-alanine ligase|nr:pantoate--beta-alanine ligase [Candidatus Omnitrophota bacterium]